MEKGNEMKLLGIVAFPSSEARETGKVFSLQIIHIYVHTLIKLVLRAFTGIYIIEINLDDVDVLTIDVFTV